MATTETINYESAINLAIKEEMQRDTSVIFIAEDVRSFSPPDMFKGIDEKRIKSTPICENSFTGMAIGAAMTGLRPVVNLNIANFVYLASDQIINQASKLHFMTGGQMHVPIVFRVVMVHNQSNAAQHSDRPYPMFMNVPGLKIVTPSTPADAKGLLKAAIRDNDPVLFFEDTNLYASEEDLPTNSDHLIPIGRGEIKRSGTDISIVSISGCLTEVMKAAQTLQEQGISAEVIDPRTLVPLDKEIILKSVRKTGHLIIVDLANRTNSAASEIAAVIGEEAFEYLRSPIQRITTPDTHPAFSPALERPLYPNAAKIIAAVNLLFEVR
ncbi:alpha-ketoacid dehydrogenase subunit beta [Porticoccaceae bacterium]|nr:alpha-ketoacid dehydrogenase subunit beta [Porticoccaceae bacterium]